MVTALSEHNTGYLDKPFEIPDLVEALEELSPGKTATEASSEESDDEGMRESISAYLTIKITDSERSMEIFDKLYSMRNIQSCDAVRGISMLSSWCRRNPRRRSRRSSLK